MPEADAVMVQAIHSSTEMSKMSQFDSANEKRLLSMVMHQYMQMVRGMILFITSIRKGDWKLHLSALETFTKALLCFRLTCLCPDDPPVPVRHGVHESL